jgi:hypothetical protein
MNLNNFAQRFSSLTLSENKGSSSSVPRPKPQNVTRQNKARQFTHGNRVTILAKNFKGYLGYVRDFHPSKSLVELLASDFIPADTRATVGQVIDTRSGRVLVTDTNYVRFKNHSSPNNEIYINPSSLIQIGIYNFNIVQILKGNGTDCEIRTFNVDGNKTPDEQLQYIAGKFEQSSNPEGLLGSEQTVPCKDAPALLFLNTGATNRGIIGKIVGPAYQIQRSIRIMMNNKSFERQTDGSVRVTSKESEYRGATGTLIREEPAQVTVIIEATGRSVQLPVSDVFYHDLILTNGNLFQVNSVSDKGTISGKERVDNQLTESQIETSQIRETLPGFQFRDAEMQRQVRDDTDFVTEQSSEATYEDDDYDESTDNVDYEQPEVEDSEIAEASGSNLDYEEPQFKSSFKDNERVTMMADDLTDTQKRIRDQIIMILQQYGVEQDVNIRNLVARVEDAFKAFKRNIKQSGLRWKDLNDGKFTIACLVLREIVRSGNASVFGNNKNIMKTFIQKLASMNFINPKYIDQNIFVSDGWSEHANSTGVDKLPIQDVYNKIMQNCNSIMDEWEGNLAFPGSNSGITEKQVIPLGTNRRRERIRRAITPADILARNIPSTSSSIIWGSNYQSTLKKYMAHLQTRIDSAPNSETLEVYKYVKDNLQRTPYALRELADSDDTMKNTKGNMLKKVFKALMTEVKNIQQTDKQRRQQQRKDIEAHRAQMKAKNDAMSQAERQDMMDVDENEETPEADTNVYIQRERNLDSMFRRLRQKEMSLADIQREMRLK